VGSPATTTTDAIRARDFDRALFVAAADELREHSWGLELRTPSLPRTRSLNGLYADSLEGIDVDILDPVAIYVAGTDAVAPGPRWARELGVFMAHRGAPPAVDPAVTETERLELVRLRREWLLDEVPDREIVDELLVAEERVFAHVAARAFTVAGDAMTLLLGDPAGPIRMVEDVYTTPSARRRGHASKLVRTAVAHAYADGAELVFLPTEYHGVAHGMYRGLGFEDLSVSTMFWRDA
jgi:GNAT superfamily N-acetyltransferase